MLKKFLSTVAVAVMASTAADYMFPTAYPSGVEMDTVKQIVSFIWDDNAYSGLAMTDYELHPDQQANNTDFANHQWVGGKKPWGAAADNKMNIQEGDMGMSWAIGKLAGALTEFPPPEYDPSNNNIQSGQQFVYHDTIWEATGWSGANNPPKLHPKYPEVNGDWESIWAFKQPLSEFFNSSMTKTNPDGSPIHFTFNVISGLFVPIIGAQDGQRVSKFGYWQPNDVDLIEFPHLEAYKSGKLPIAWGREMPVKADFDSEGNVNGEAYGRINDAFKLTNTLGHEIGNHTIDHLESNSMLPNAKGKFPAGTNGEWYRDGFAAWGGAGFAADHISPKKWGDYDTTVSEVDEFGRKEGITWHYMGWEIYAGKTLPYAAWKGLIELGEEDLEIELGLTPLRKGGTVGSFRAPRLEVNGALHYALRDLGYMYDCGQEEGYEYHIDGTNFYWPYTTDNGSPNVSWQRSIGEQMTIDSMPDGFWQIPVNAMIVPKDIRESVWNNYEIIAKAEGETLTTEDKEHWINQSGRVTGFDFNMFILWGMTKDNALKTLKYNLDQRLAGGKAPMQIGCHTDYFTPIYDNATLLSEENRPTYGLCVDKGWNTWEDRKATFEEFIDYGLNDAKNKGKVYFWSGAQTIEYVRKIAQSDKIGKEVAFDKEWTFFKNTALNSSTTKETCVNDIVAEVTIAKAEGEEAPQVGYGTYFVAGTLDSLDHISMNYKTTAPLAVKLIMDGDRPWEVWLNNLGTAVESGNIPLTAFHYNQYDMGTNKQPDPAKITGIEIVPITYDQKAATHTISVSDIKVYTGEKTQVAIDAQKSITKNDFKVTSLTSNALQLNLAKSGTYSVELHAANGRMIKSFDNMKFGAGLNKLPLNNIASGVYMITIKNGSFKTALKSMVL